MVTAQPIEGRPFVPQTVAEIRAALPDDAQREKFDHELADANAFEVSGVVDEWWPRALLADQADEIAAEFAAIRRGEVELIPAAEVVPSWPHR
jgi:hypothetical protein